MATVVAQSAQPNQPAITKAHITSKWLHGYVRERGGALHITNSLVISG